jgi:hypothetical protein
LNDEPSMTQPNINDVGDGLLEKRLSDVLEEK